MCLIHYLGADTEGLDFSAVPSGYRVCNVYGHEHDIAENLCRLVDDRPLENVAWT